MHCVLLKWTNVSIIDVWIFYDCMMCEAFLPERV